MSILLLHTGDAPRTRTASMDVIYVVVDKLLTYLVAEQRGQMVNVFTRKVGYSRFFLALRWGSLVWLYC